jgi:hypothetical protein
MLSTKNPICIANMESNYAFCVLIVEINEIVFTTMLQMTVVNATTQNFIVNTTNGKKTV